MLREASHDVHGVAASEPRPRRISSVLNSLSDDLCLRSPRNAPVQAASP